MESWSLERRLPVEIQAELTVPGEAGPSSLRRGEPVLALALPRSAKLKRGWLAVGRDHCYRFSMANGVTSLGLGPQPGTPVIQTHWRTRGRYWSRFDDEPAVTLYAENTCHFPSAGAGNEESEGTARGCAHLRSLPAVSAGYADGFR